MLKSVSENVVISGIATVIPKKELCLLNDASLYDGDEKQLKRVMRSSGFHTRRVVEEGVTASDLCEAAARILIKDMNIEPSTIDALIFLTQTPDYYIPATACILQHKLGLPIASAAFDVNQGCAGYGYGLWLASMLANAGCKKVLLLVGDTSSKYTDMFKAHNSAPVFGDAGSATLVEYTPGAEPIFFDIGNDGSQYEAIMAENGGFRNVIRQDMFCEDGTFQYNARMDGLKVMEFTLSRVPQSVHNVLASAKVSKDEIDYFIFHQANKFILENIADSIDIPLNKVPMKTLSKYGNQSCTSIPSAICDALKNEVSSKKLKLCLSGFGIGLSWVSVVINTSNIYCSGIREF